jgi:hypothetical protein
MLPSYALGDWLISLVSSQMYSLLNYGGVSVMGTVSERPLVEPANNFPGLVDFFFLAIPEFGFLCLAEYGYFYDFHDAILLC